MRRSDRPNYTGDFRVANSGLAAGLQLGNPATVNLPTPAVWLAFCAAELRAPAALMCLKSSSNPGWPDAAPGAYNDRRV